MKYFKISEFDCQETGHNKMSPEFLNRIDELRAACGFPFVITSGYRAVTHSAEAAKEKPGMHTEGIAADVSVTNGVQRRKIVAEAIKLGFKGIGVAKDFVHVDIREGQGIMWTY